MPNITQIHQTLTSQTGWLNTSRPLTPEDLQGRIILIDFWTFCCINCIHVIPDLKYLEEKFGDKLTVIGVHSAKFKNEQDSENIRSAILRYDIHHPVVNDFDFSIWQRFGIRAWPTFVLINPKGTMQQIYSGEGNREEAEADIATLIAQYGEKINTTPLPIAPEKDKAPRSLLSFPGKFILPMINSGMADPLLISDSGNNRIVRMDLNANTLFGQIGSGKQGFKDGSFDTAEFNNPQGLVDDRRHWPATVYVADTGNHAIRKLDFTTGTVTTVAGTGQQGYERSTKNAPALETPLASPWDLAFYPDKNHIAIAMAGTHQIWSYDIDKKTVSVIAGNGRESIDDGRMPFNSLSQPSGLSAHNGKLYFVDSETSSLRVLENGEVTTLIGTGLFDFGYKEGKQGIARMQHPLGVFADDSGVYIADSYNHSIRRYDPETKILSNFAGHGARGNQDGALANASFNEPNDIEKIGDAFYIADTNNNAIRVIEKDKVRTLSLHEETAAEFSDTLPNVETLPAQTLQNSAEIRLELNKGWHINKDAPSMLTIFNAEKHPVKTFELEEIKREKLALPTLSEGTTYRLQATLYYCEDKQGAQCLIKSFDIEINADARGKKQLALIVK